MPTKVVIHTGPVVPQHISDHKELRDVVPGDLAPRSVSIEITSRRKLQYLTCPLNGTRG